MLLAIDTATTFSGLALYDGNGPAAECVWHSGRNHTAQLLPQIDAMLQNVGATPADLQVLAVSLGPGSWSGLRAGLSLAKGMALAADLPLIGISTLEALAYQAAEAGRAVLPLLRLGRGRYAAALFSADPLPERATADTNLTIDELAALISEPTTVCGELDAAVRSALQPLQRSGLVAFPPQAALLRRPGYLAALAWQRHLLADYDDLTTLEPIYLGDAVKPAP
jgi:tRNA threonylcarbamoyladenosine biosynthesis protein TsaB